VALLRTHATGCAFVVGGFARTAETQALVESGWARDLLAPRDRVRARSPRIVVPGDTDVALERDPGARAARLPAVAFAAVRAALADDRPVLVQVPRRGYVPTLACAKCRAAARCRRCNGPMQLPSGAGDVAASPSCRWCGNADAAYRCAACGSRALRAQVIGASRTAEELGRAFAGVVVTSSGGSEVLDEVPAGARLVVATIGAEPVVPGGYGAALLLDAWALLGRADLRAAEETLRRWMTAAALVRSAEAGGQVIVVADPGHPTVQALVRWDPVGHAAGQAAERAEVRFPPAVRIAAVDGPLSAIEDLVATADLPGGVEVLGPVPLPTAAERQTTTDAQRLLLRVAKASGLTLSRSLAAAQAARSARKADPPVRVQIDPIDLG
jgi:primosomal protein N' (replication factor Y)